MVTVEIAEAVLKEELQNVEFPHVWCLPELSNSRRGKFDAEGLVNKAQKALLANDKQEFGQVFTDLICEFQPLIDWGISCWHFLLTTEGLRFLERNPYQKLLYRGDYRPFTEKDYTRLVYRSFKRCLLEYSNYKNRHNSSRKRDCNGASFHSYLKKQFWNKILREYKRLENPSDSRQRKLTAYSYLRCIPYRFLNPYHHRRVESILNRLSLKQREAIRLYFLCFLKDGAASKVRKVSKQDFLRGKRKALRQIRTLDSLVYNLLLQIERY